MSSPAGLSLEEIEALYRRYGPAVLHRCTRLIGDPDRAWDAMQATFVRAIRYGSTYTGEGEPLTWLLSIAFRVSMDDIRRASRGPLACYADTDVETLEAEPDELTMEERLDQQRAMTALLPQLDQQQQRLAVLRYADGLAVSQIAEILGMSERTVARRMSILLERARKLVGGRRKS